MRIDRVSRCLLAVVMLAALVVAPSAAAAEGKKKKKAPAPVSAPITYYLHFTGESGYVCCGYMDFSTNPTSAAAAFGPDSASSHTFPARQGTPFVLDATKPVRVAFRLSSTITAGATFEVTIAGEVDGREREIASGSETIMASVFDHVVDLELEADPLLDRRRVDSLSLTVMQIAGVTQSFMYTHEAEANTQEAFLEISQITDAPSAPRPVDVMPVNCTHMPTSSLPTIPADASKELEVEVRVVVEPKDRALAETYVESAIEIYDRIGITLKASYDEMLDPTTGVDELEIYDALRAVYGGARPPGVDVVYLMTRNFGGGTAMCTGGVADPNLAFALGSLTYEETFINPAAPEALLDEGIIMAHEIGHLLGGHHHYGNCAQALPGGMPHSEAGLCTVMSPIALTLSRVFGTVETAVIRDFVARYAKG